jgi:hypothetical protein
MVKGESSCAYRWDEIASKQARATSFDIEVPTDDGTLVGGKFDS